MENTIYLESKRLVLRTLDESFAENVLDYYKKNRTFLDNFSNLEYYGNSISRFVLSIVFTYSNPIESTIKLH